MGGDMRLDSLPSWEQGMVPLDLAADTALERETPPVPEAAVQWPKDAESWADALPLLLILLLLFLSPVLYDLCRWLGTR